MLDKLLALIVFIIAFAACYGYINSQFGAVIGGGNMDQIAKVTDPIILYFNAMDEKLAFLKFISDALNGKVLSILLLLAISALIVFPDFLKIHSLIPVLFFLQDQMNKS